jgi:hypothetical protein
MLTGSHMDGGSRSEWNHPYGCPLWRHILEAHSGLEPGIASGPKSANNGSPAASLWKSCFVETIDIHLSLPLTGMGYPFRYSEMGLNLKELGHRLPSFCISP